jgi:hypothetical protein
LVWAVTVSLAATQVIAFAFSSSGYLDVSVPQVCLLMPYVFRHGYYSITNSGFPHSDILGSKLTYSSPRRFAVRRVLLRLLVPRHSPCALSNLTKLKKVVVDFFKFDVNSRHARLTFSYIIRPVNVHFVSICII